MIIENNAVWNINPIIYYRYILGFTQNFKSSGLFVKLFPIILATSMLILVYFKLKALVLQKYLLMCEYLVYASVSWFTKDEYIHAFYKYRYTIDNFPGALKQYRKLEILAKLGIFFSILIRAYQLFTLIYSFPILLFNHELYLLYFLYFANDMGRFTISLCLGLLYYRSKVLVMAFKVIDFNDKRRNRSAVNTFIQMYETVADALQDVGRPLRLLVSSVYLLQFRTSPHTRNFSFVLGAFSYIQLIHKQAEPQKLHMAFKNILGVC